MPDYTRQIEKLPRSCPNCGAAMTAPGPLEEAWKAAKVTLYGLSLDIRQAEIAQTAIDRMDHALRTAAGEKE